MSDIQRWSTPDRSGGRRRSGGGGGDGGDDGGEETTADPKEKKGSKKMSLFRLRKGKKRKQRGVNVNPGCWGAIGGGGGAWRCACLNQPDSPGESPTSDPNSSEFTFDMLRVLIEKNDFYSNECNPHLGPNT